MSRKGWIISAVVGLLIAIGIGSTFVFSSGKGEVMELSPLEMKKFMSEDGTGFVMLTSNMRHSEDWIFLVKKIAEKEKIEVKGLDEDSEIKFDELKESNEIEYKFKKDVEGKYYFLSSKTNI